MSIGELNTNQFPGTRGLYHLSSVTDASPNGFDLTVVNSVSFVPGKFGNCANFGSANVDSYLQVNGNNLGISNGETTMSCWVKIQGEIGAGAWSILHHTDSGTHVYYEISYEFNGGTPRLVFTRTRRTISSDNVNRVGSLNDGFWHHIVLTYDTTNVKGYVDGEFAGSTASAGDGGGAAAVTGMFMGIELSNVDGGGSFFSGYIDEACITQIALSQSQVKDYYAWALGRKTSVV